ncbi:MAG: hypothetical protein B1H07_02155 [Campylobacteraceae bacterium 4484_166]|nr:MAG: hypothetical protein B1H07_02155 [Campylobacteraceae bacterium 4484_166]
MLHNTVAEHEIPKGSRVYFGTVAKRKREFEHNISKLLEKLGFEEIVTPSFSFDLSKNSIREPISIVDDNNNKMILRNDSTKDVVRIITKRLGRSTTHKKWFYAQSVFNYPSKEQYQIGAEWIGCQTVENIIDICLQTTKLIKDKLYLQLFNMNIIKTICKNFDIDIDIFMSNDIDKILKLNIKWLTKLLYSQTIDDIKESIDISPLSIKDELNILYDIALKIKHKDIIISPLYCSNIDYYDGVSFEIIKDNYTISRGGKYMINGELSSGFSLYVDDILKLLNKGKI